MLPQRHSLDRDAAQSPVPGTPSHLILQRSGSAFWDEFVSVRLSLQQPRGLTRLLLPLGCRQLAPNSGRCSSVRSGSQEAPLGKGLLSGPGALAGAVLGAVCPPARAPRAGLRGHPTPSGHDGSRGTPEVAFNWGTDLSFPPGSDLLLPALFLRSKNRAPRPSASPDKLQKPQPDFRRASWHRGLGGGGQGPPSLSVSLIIWLSLAARSIFWRNPSLYSFRQPFGLNRAS